MKSPPEAEEKNKLLNIESTINDMLNKVLEDNDPQDNLNQEPTKTRRISTINQTFNLPFKNVCDKENQNFFIQQINNTEFLPNFSNSYQSFNFPMLRNLSSDFPNNINNNYNNFINQFNSLNTNNNANYSLNFNNNSNIPLQQELSFNNLFESPNINNNIFQRNKFPLSNSVVYNEQKDAINNNSQNLLNYNNFVNNNNFKNNFTGNYNINNNAYFASNTNFESFKRREKRRKTYDIPFILENNINNCFKNIDNKSLSDNSLYDYSKIDNKIDINNSSSKNKIVYPVKDSFIYEIKSILEKTGRIDYHVYYLIKGKFLSILKTHKGSKLFQNYLKFITQPEIIHLLYLELSQNLEEFITNEYSNYFCTKFFICLGQNDRIDFLKKIENSIVEFSCHNIGTYPIQTIIENLNSDIEKFILIKSIKDHIEELVYNPYGCHVLEKLLSCVEEEYISFIYSYMIDNFLRLAYNCNGICLVKKILTFTDKKFLQDKIKKIVKENAFGLIQHPYGNFVIQVIIECWNNYKEIINLYKDIFINLSLEKYASNVIERFIEKDEEILNNFIDEIIKSNRISEIMKSNFGNYVIQKVIKLSKNKYKNKIVFCAAKDINNLIENKLILKWKSLLMPHLNELTFEQIQELKQRNYFENKNINNCKYL